MSHHAHQPKQRNWFARHKVLTGVGAVVAVVAIGGAVSGGGEEDKPATARAADADTGNSTDTGGKGAGEGAEKDKGDGKGKEGKKKSGLSGNGTYQVGSDIKPGTYHSEGNKLGCYWERSKDSKGDVDSILANDNVVGSSYVTIGTGDKIFKTRGCKSWTLVSGEKSGTPKSEVPGNGMYRVGVDIAPGTYKAEGNKTGCYWERSKDALHEVDSIEANENVSGSGIVTVTAEDAYFKTNGCAVWKKTG
ncbi:hypothetical protein ACFQ2B_19150 [Streptomyces stramineus]|uniref:Lipoprotein n=1 Tax=Streptomyces stramineus TaxID=173861 RepID=A0ABP3JCT9_9ACTN